MCSSDLPALMLSARRRTARPLQVLFVVTAVFLLDFALLAQSRAMFVVMLLVLLVFLLWTSDRLRVLTRALAIAAASALALDPVFGVIRAPTGTIRSRLRSSTRPAGSS